MIKHKQEAYMNLPHRVAGEMGPAFGFLLVFTSNLDGSLSVQKRILVCKSAGICRLPVAAPAPAPAQHSLSMRPCSFFVGHGKQNTHVCAARGRTNTCSRR